MKRPPLIGLFLFVLTAESSPAQVRLGDDTVVLFATGVEAKKILTAQDDFVRRMSPFDRAARMKTDRTVPEREYLEFVGTNVLEWDDSEKLHVASALAAVQTKLAKWSLPLPKEVFVVKTTGAEEGGAAYTRANAIILPKAEIAAPTARMRKMICHELFHILSRSNPKLRERLYAGIGFVKCNEVEFPTELKSRKITNPDAPANDHCVLLQIEGRDRWAIPILFSAAEKYDTARGGEFFEYLQFQFLVVERQDKTSDVRPGYDDRQPRLVGLQQVAGFIEQVGRNSEYFIHPEEILADNFVLLILENGKVPSPEIIAKMNETLRAKRTVGLDL